MVQYKFFEMFIDKKSGSLYKLVFLRKLCELKREKVPIGGKLFFSEWSEHEKD